MEFPGRSLWVIGYTFGLHYVYSRRYYSLDQLPQRFHLRQIHETLSLTPSLLFISPRTNQRPRLRLKAQNIVLGPYPYNSPSKLWFFPLIWGEKVGFWFLRVKTIRFSGLHMWEYRFTRLITVTDTSEQAMHH